MKINLFVLTVISLCVLLSGCAVSGSSPIEAELLVVTKDAENGTIGINKLTVADNTVALSPAPVLTLDEGELDYNTVLVGKVRGIL